ncbi:MAG: AAA family ATPase [Planctomycetes bacterium]|nr:AAA family ATPase [Planctomycetota bacterium]
MKVAITGKGGVGKTTLAALLAQAWAREGAKVLAIDVDPVASLAGALGFADPQNITPLSQMNELVEERTGAKPGTMGQMFKLNPTVDDLPEKIAHEHNGVKLIVMGGIKEGGGGCVCPESALVKALVRHIILQRDEHVIMDMEAGVEHLGRSTADSVNVMVVVVEPGMRSIRAAQQIKKLATQIGIKNIKAVGNKIRNVEDKKFITDNLKDIKVIGFLPFTSEIIDADKQGALEIKNSQISETIKSIKNSL